ncbi:MAG: GLPGLI family protein [Psychroflexus sp.]
MKRIFFLLLVIVSIQAISQSELKDFTANFEVTYRLEYISDSTNLDKKSTEDFYLFVGEHTSKFISVNKRIGDSITKKMVENFNGSINLSNKNIPKTKFSEVIYKNYHTNQLFFVGRIGSDKFLYEEDIQPYTWDIKEKKKVINNFKVQKAITKFGGREYTAWFTEEIPIPQGPYKFDGLPGLIVEIEDSESHYSYQLISFKDLDKGKKIEYLNTNDGYVKTTKHDFYNSKKDYYSDYFKRLNQKGFSFGLSSKEKRKVQQKFDKRNNPIELE